ncbi:MAG: MarC family protein [Terracidiphilus sp.]
MLIWTTFVLAFSALLPMINPLGSALNLMGIVGDVPPAAYKYLARKIAINNVIFLTVIEVTGSAILRFFGVSIPVVEVSGGIVIAAIGWSVLNAPATQTEVQFKNTDIAAKTDAGHKVEQMLFYPLTFPVTSGPGTLVLMLTLSAHVSNPSLARNILGHIGIFIAVIVLSLMVYLCYAYAPKLTLAIAPSTVRGILRVVAFILLTIGVQIAWNGLSVLLKSVLVKGT